MTRLTGLKLSTSPLLRSGHALALSIVAGGCLIGQAAILSRHPLAFQLPDSPSYISLGSLLLAHPSLSNLFDAYRTPGYPVALAVIGGVQGQVAGDGVVFVQAGLMVLTAFELYVLTFGLTGSSIAAGLAGFIFATNVRLLDWERLIMTEALAIFLVATTVLAFWQWMRHRRRVWAVGFTAASILAVLTRPSLIYLPICLVLLLVAGDRKRWLPAALLGAAIYAPLLGYGIVNDRLHPHAGLSAISNINLLGKVLEYRMQGEGDPGRFPTLWQGITNLPKGDADPYHILQANPQSMGPDYWDAYRFSQDIVLSHPIEYVEKSAGDLVQEWLAVPYAYIPPGDLRWVSQALADYSLVAYAAYPALLLVIAALLVMWRRLDRQVALGIGALLLTVAGTLVTTALFSYVDFARLRTPVDGLAFVAVIAMSAQLLKRVGRA